jgi:hypothetical protein
MRDPGTMKRTILVSIYLEHRLAHGRGPGRRGTEFH